MHCFFKWWRDGGGNWVFSGAQVAIEGELSGQELLQGESLAKPRGLRRSVIVVAGLEE